MEKFSFEIEGFHYVFDPNQLDLNKKLEIQSIPEREKPRFLYKYYSLSPYNIDALKKNYSYASSRFELNDEFDCLESLIDMKDVSDQDIISFYSHFHPIETVKEKIHLFRLTFPIHKAINYYGGFGVISLSENIYSKTMWAHYASSNHGYVIKFNLNNFNEQMLGPFPVNYRKNWIPVKLCVIPEMLAFLYMTNIKSDDWKYEEEWRYIGVGRKMSFPRYQMDKELVENRKFSYTKEAIDEIILGHRFIHDINKYMDENNRVLVLVQTPDVQYGNEKIELLRYIVENNIKTSRIILKERSNTFDFDIQSVNINKIDNYSFYMEI